MARLAKKIKCQVKTILNKIGDILTDTKNQKTLKRDLWTLLQERNSEEGSGTKGRCEMHFCCTLHVKCPHRLWCLNTWALVGLYGQRPWVHNSTLFTVWSLTNPDLSKLPLHAFYTTIDFSQILNQNNAPPREDELSSSIGLQPHERWVTEYPKAEYWGYAECAPSSNVKEGRWGQQSNPARKKKSLAPAGFPGTHCSALRGKRTPVLLKFFQ